tara:strand:+ start:479 stop:601 length:123 start_codon:yes stop_codon:yes gene_type:complete
MKLTFALGSAISTVAVVTQLISAAKKIRKYLWEADAYFLF